MKVNYDRMVRAGEGLQVEFKSQMPQLHRMAKTFSAFANSSGGYIFFGVSDDGQLAGLNQVEGTQELAEQVANFHCDPRQRIELEVWRPVPGIQILVVFVPESDNKPVYAVNPHQTKDAWPYFRSSKENLPIDKKSLKAMRKIAAVDPEDLGEIDPIQVRIMNFLNEKPRRTLSQIGKSLNMGDQRIKKVLVELERNGWVNGFFNEKRREFSVAIPWKRR